MKLFHADRWSRPFAGVLAYAASAALSACVAPVGPVEVTRFHAADISPLGHGTIRVEPVQGQPDDMEFRTFAGAVTRELTRLGYTIPLSGEAGSSQVALLRLERRTYQPQRDTAPVSAGAGGSTGSYGTSVGIGIGIDLSGPPPAQVETKLSVTIQHRASGKHLWEGRAAYTVRDSSPMAQTPLGAAKMAEALFKGFPGQSGETILVK